MSRKPRDRYTKDELPDDAPKPEDKALVQWDVHSTIHSWRTELDQELIDLIVQASASLLFKKQVALACGVKPQLFEAWLAEGMRDDGPPLMQQLAVRFHAVQAAQAMSYLNMVAIAAARGEYTAATWVLSHRFPDWADRKGGSVDQLPAIEADSSAPVLSMAQREEQAISALKNPNPQMAELMRKAGIGPVK